MIDTGWTRTTKYIVGVGVTLFGLFILYISQAVLPLLIIASLVAFLLMPVVDFFTRRLKMPRIVAVLTAYLVLLIVLLLAPLLLIPPIIDGVNTISRVDYQILVVNFITGLRENLIALQGAETEFFGFTLDMSIIADPALEFLQNTNVSTIMALPSFETIFNSISSALTITFDVATSVAGTVFSGFFAGFLTLLYAIYISLNADEFPGVVIKVVPEIYRPEVTLLFARLSKIWRAYFRGQITLMIIIGLVTWAGNTALGLPGAFTLAVIAGVLELIPSLGPFLAAIPAVIVALIQGSTYLGVSPFVFALIVTGFYIAVQQFENAFVVPRVLGEAVELHPLVVMVGVVVGASFAGILGALLAAPVIASTREILSYVYAKILDKDPFPPPLVIRIPEDEASFLERGQVWVMKGRELTRWLLDRFPKTGSKAPFDSSKQSPPFSGDPPES